MICTGCQQDLPLEGFYLQRGKPKKRCKECVKAYFRKWYTPTGRRAGRPKKEKMPVEQGPRAPYGVSSEFRLFARMPAASATLRATPDLPPESATA